MSGLFLIILTEHFHASLLLVVGNSIQFYKWSRQTAEVMIVSVSDKKKITVLIKVALVY